MDGRRSGLFGAARLAEPLSPLDLGKPGVQLGDLSLVLRNPRRPFLDLFPFLLLSVMLHLCPGLPELLFELAYLLGNLERILFPAFLGPELVLLLFQPSHRVHIKASKKK